MPPKIGDIEKGYMFSGGDPSDKSNWTKVQTPGALTGTARALTHGLTLGGGDEIGSAIAAGPASLMTGHDYGDVYRSMMGRLSAEREQFGSAHPVLQTGAEIAGGVATGLAGASKLAATKAGGKLVASTPKWVPGAALGTAEGAVYGALSADPGDRAESAAKLALMGGLAAPIAAWGTEKIGRGGITLFKWAKNKLTDTPRKEAVRAIRAAMEAEGLDPRGAAKVYESLGTEGMVADIGENFRALTRAASDLPGPTKANIGKVLDARQRGQGGRILSAAENAIGARAKDLPKTAADIAARRFESAHPVYAQAYEEGVDITQGKIAEVLTRSSMKQAMRQASKIASNLGEEFDEGTLRHLHYAKQALWEQIDRAKGRAKGPLKKLYGDFIDAIGEQNKTYLRANDMWSSDSKLIDAAQEGRNFFRMKPSEMQEMLSGFTKGEGEMFQMGAMAAFQDMLDTVPMTSDATRKFINTTGSIKKLAMLFGGDEKKAMQFISSAEREAAFGRTRNVVSGGSPTSQNLAGQRFLEDSIQPESLVSLMVDPVGAAVRGVKELVGSKPVSNETLKELGDMLMDKGMTAEQVQAIFSSPRFTSEISNLSNPLYVRGAAGAAVPILAE